MDKKNLMDKKHTMDKKNSMPVIMKSYQNGIIIYLDEGVPFEEILLEIERKFKEARAFFQSAQMALSFEGRELSHSEEVLILETIRRCSEVNIVCIVGRKDDDTDKYFAKVIQQIERKVAEGDEGRFYRGTLKNREVLETETSIVILGDVYPGCAVISTKNIIILGGLYGEAYAGGNGAAGHYIVALEMEPERIKIGDFKYRHAGKQSKWGIRPKVQPKIAFVKDERIVFEPLTKELLGSF
jgi:septum site-determining protein MinC